VAPRLVHDSPPFHIPTSVPCFFPVLPRPPSSTLFPYTTLFRSQHHARARAGRAIDLPGTGQRAGVRAGGAAPGVRAPALEHDDRSEEHTSELQSPYDLVCRLLLEKKNRSRCWRSRTSISTHPLP